MISVGDYWNRPNVYRVENGIPQGVAGPSPVVPTNVGHGIVSNTGSIPVRSTNATEVVKEQDMGKRKLIVLFPQHRM